MSKTLIAILAFPALVCMQTGCADFSIAAHTPPVPAQDAHVYVQTRAGIMLYDATSDGRLTAVAGSPFSVAGTIAGVSGNNLITFDGANLYAYDLAASGAVKDQVAQISTQSYDGKQCGRNGYASFDRSGQDLYVIMSGAHNHNLATLCVAIESFRVGSSGSMSYLGTVIPYDDSSGTTTAAVYYSALVFTGGNIYAYSSAEGLAGNCGEPAIVAFHRQSSGALELASAQRITLPEPPPGGFRYLPYYLSADSSNHVVAFGPIAEAKPCGTRGAAQLATFTVNTDGSIVSTDRYQNMPTAEPQSGAGLVLGPVSPTDNVVPVALGNNLQLFHLNGASPITSATGQIPVEGLIMTSLQWDNSGHLYGLDTYMGLLHAYTVTAGGITEDAGSPLTLSSEHWDASGLLVVSR